MCYSFFYHFGPISWEVTLKNKIIRKWSLLILPLTTTAIKLTSTLELLLYFHYITTTILRPSYLTIISQPLFLVCHGLAGGRLYQFFAGERRRLSLWKWKVSSPKLSTLLILLLAFVSNALFGLEVESK